MPNHWNVGQAIDFTYYEGPCDDEDDDGICDDVDDCVGVYDECGVCDGPGLTTCDDGSQVCDPADCPTNEDLLPPENLTASAGDQSVTLNWNAPDDGGGGGDGGGEGGGDGGGTFEQEITLTALTNFFTVDTQTPDVTVTSPDGGETFNEGQMVNVSWSASDINLADNPVSISLSVGQGGSYEAVAYSLENSGQYTATLPYTQTEYARFKVDVFDNFGYSNSDESDEYFTIGQTEDEEYLDSTLVITALTDFFTVDTEDPSIMIIYPNGGEFIDNPANVNLQWSISDMNLETATINASVASGLGGYYILVDSDIPSDQTSSNVDMSGVEQTLWARVQMDITDDFGNSSSDKRLF